MKFLEEVERLAVSLGVEKDVAYTCESASHFYMLKILSSWESFLNLCEQSKELTEDKKGPDFFVSKNFPFTKYFETTPVPIFSEESMKATLGNFDAEMREAEGCWRHIQHIFDKLEECRVFEVLKGSQDRQNFLVTKQARIIAMTCTHAAMKRSELIRLGFQYSNLVMEEAAQILEVETFIPMTLQQQKEGEVDAAVGKLKRVVLIGDHNQLPPVIKNKHFQRHCKLDQSLFTRLVRLGVPYIELDAQGRSRPSMASLYSWRYKDLKDLPHTSKDALYLSPNPGFLHSFQLIDVGDFEGRGETEPNRYFYQNLGEAEYVVAVYQYMRLMGYPASKISILTTYNGQKQLLKDIIEQRCVRNPNFPFGKPQKVATVDKFQGQQNDIILLSLVRTRAVGHIRDVRRLVVAMSRARFGLYVFGRQSLFANCYELTPVFSQFLKTPLTTKLQLLPQERYSTPFERDAPKEGQVVEIQDVIHMGKLVDSFSREMFNYQQQMWMHQQQQFLQQQEQERLEKEDKEKKDKEGEEEGKGKEKEEEEGKGKEKEEEGKGKEKEKEDVEMEG
eukprot:CAMPEP_0201526470 /NCGR_PEP_ID=MMETSP0161_2-20130828/31941_1 /ASSEMBLY_ACC=CAM_ASM_000251 /TAXON_ID=180227 /ORGANISM="Neoparamoeba aestuarina, Strain SoJaBio B1-5/56/2" /LENGTH=560 /DNA_ID=CAMNT_0047926877 /DNA_START=147 /DNA_END=1829 /DNA_ORIENTATION=-